jgi:hypothetical protein
MYLTSSAILYVCFVSYCSLYDLTYGGVVGLSFPTNSTISCLYPSIIYVIILSFSSTLSSLASALSIIVWNTSSSVCSNLSTCHLSSSCSICTSLRMISSSSFSSLVVSEFLAFVLALDFTSCPMLICNLYSAFVAILDNVNSHCSTSFKVRCLVSSSTCNML